MARKTSPTRQKRRAASGPRGVGAKEKRQYEHIKTSAKRSGRYGGRAKEVAARTVLKQHRAQGHRPGK